MDNFIKDTILQGVDLTYIKTDKFKTGYLSVCLTAPLSKKAVSKNAVLPFVLRRGTSTHPDMESISSALDDLYGATITPVVRKRGEAQIFGFSATFVDDKYVPGNEKIFEKTSALVAEMLLYPNTVNGRLNEEYVKSEKDNLIDQIRSIINNKQIYAVYKMLKKMYGDEPYSLSELGEESEAKKISVATLTKHYHEVISTSKVEIFYYGSLDYNMVKDALVSAFSSIPRGNICFDVPTNISDIEDGREIVTIKETMPNISQGKLALGVRLGMSYQFLSIAALYVFNTVYGGGVMSKLFSNVRERLSLCYYANSTVDFFKGVMLVMSGIDKDKYDVAVNEILLQLDNVKKGEISDSELENAKAKVISDLKTVMDSQRAAEMYFIDRFSSGVFFTPEEMIELVKKVTVEDIVKLCKTVKPDTIYFLYGEEDKDNEQ